MVSCKLCVCLIKNKWNAQPSIWGLLLSRSSSAQPLVVSRSALFALLPFCMRMTSLMAPGQSNRSHLKKLSLIRWAPWYNLGIYTLVSAVGAFFGCNQKATLKGPGICNIVSFSTFVVSCLLRGVRLYVIFTYVQNTL